MSDQPAPSKRQKKDWVRIDTGEETVDDYMERLKHTWTLSQSNMLPKLKT